jgi:addiction module RelE/StbE family toxin
MTLRWTLTALRDLESLTDYISEDSVTAARSMVESISAAVAALQRHPEMGRRGRVDGTRELVMAPYVVAYRVRRTALEVVAIIHGARRWPERF